MALLWLVPAICTNVGVHFLCRKPHAFFFFFFNRHDNAAVHKTVPHNSLVTIVIVDRVLVLFRLRDFACLAVEKCKKELISIVSLPVSCFLFYSSLSSSCLYMNVGN